MERKTGRIHAPAGNLDCLKAAVDNGADVVYLGFAGPSNLRNFRGINFSDKNAAEGIEYAHARGKRVHVTINSIPGASELASCDKALAQAASLGADAVICSDLGVMQHARENHPDMKICLSVQAGACNVEAIKFYQREFGIDHLILPRVLTLDQIRTICENTDVDIEVFAFGSLCINYEGKCCMSSYITGESTNTVGTCSTPKYVSFQEKGDWLIARMNGRALGRFPKASINSNHHLEQGIPKEELTQWGNHFLINRRQICKWKYVGACKEAGEKEYYALNNIVYLNVLPILPDLIKAGVTAFKIEGRQRNAQYVANATRMFRQAIDACLENPENYQLPEELSQVSEELFPGIPPTLGRYGG